MNKENCALMFFDEIILYYDARSKKHQIQVSQFIYPFKDSAWGPIYEVTTTRKQSFNLK